MGFLTGKKPKNQERQSGPGSAQGSTPQPDHEDNELPCRRLSLKRRKLSPKNQRKSQEKHQDVSWTVSINGEVWDIGSLSQHMLGRSRSLAAWLQDEKRNSSLEDLELMVYKDGTVFSSDYSLSWHTTSGKDTACIIQEAFYHDQTDRGFHTNPELIGAAREDPIVWDVISDGQIWDVDHHYLCYSPKIAELIQNLTQLQHEGASSFCHGFYRRKSGSIMSKTGEIEFINKAIDDFLQPAFSLARKQVPARSLSETKHQNSGTVNSSIGLLRIPGWAEQDRRAEYDMRFSREDRKFQFMTLAGNDGSVQYLDYIPIDQSLPIVVERAKWEVGIACARFRITKLLNNDTLAHWGVYIRNMSASPNVQWPQDKYKIYGMNWTNDFHEDLELEAIWSNAHEWKRDFERDEIELINVDTENISHTMYFSWAEFVLAAQYVLREFKSKGLSKGPFERHLARVQGFSYWYKPYRAYSLFRANCQHFCRRLIKRMKDNDWEQESRINDPFCPDDLSNTLAKRGKENTWRLEDDPSLDGEDIIVDREWAEQWLAEADKRRENKVRLGLSFLGLPPEKPCRIM